ncbi:LysR substrate-binding domain-containing protein [Streptomyces sp. NPDC057705]|uniref:LysR substrate-binding domain-containing protein n=1 Tax=Streptomyces sp. NPDC057705 TaxID=3346222 RepID=UPI0036756DE7
MGLLPRRGHRLAASAGTAPRRQVEEGAVDVAFLGLPTTERLQGAAARELARDRLVAVVAPDPPLADEPVVDLRRLSSEVVADQRYMPVSDLPCRHE